MASRGIAPVRVASSPIFSPSVRFDTSQRTRSGSDSDALRNGYGSARGWPGGQVGLGSLCSSQPENPPMLPTVLSHASRAVHSFVAESQAHDVQLCVALHSEQQESWEGVDLLASFLPVHSRFCPALHIPGGAVETWAAAQATNRAAERSIFNQYSCESRTASLS